MRRHPFWNIWLSFRKGMERRKDGHLPYVLGALKAQFEPNLVKAELHEELEKAVEKVLQEYRASGLAAVEGEEPRLALIATFSVQVWQPPMGDI